MLKHINSENFEEEVLKSEKPVLVDFFATWCGPCRMLGPVLEKISQEKNEFDIAKIDIDKNRELAYEYKIEVVPTLILLKNGQELKREEGFLDEEEILEMVKKYL